MIVVPVIHAHRFGPLKRMIGIPGLVPLSSCTCLLRLQSSCTRITVDTYMYMYACTCRYYC